MNVEVLYSAIAVGGMAGGWLLRGAVGWGIRGKIISENSAKLAEHSQKIEALKAHAVDNDRHLVKGREDSAQTRIEANQERMAETMDRNHSDICRKLDNINSRCERRMQDCGSHIGALDRKIAAMSKRPNGD